MTPRILLAALLGAATLHACTKAPAGEAPGSGAQAQPAPAATAAQALDTRQIIRLNDEQREHVLGEMRGLLLAQQTLLYAAADADREAFAAAAREAGRGGTPEEKRRYGLNAVMPPEFLSLSRSMRSDFTALGELAAGGAEWSALTRGLGDVTSTCVACHNGYQIVLE